MLNVSIGDMKGIALAIGAFVESFSLYSILDLGLIIF
jgi:hypothetical protein